MAREVKELVDDQDAAKDFLRNVMGIKKAKRRRNLASMIANSLNPDKEQVDYVKANIEDFYAEAAEMKINKKIHDFEVKKERQHLAIAKRDLSLEEKAKHSVL